ncbi:exported hypothetical protein [Candidatus Sulfobium mesophilum]|uniref:Lipoprotein n=1 Tax=Candidatus Sulfobium mesophilum TaxID=2016548 RepID=A0A2U3QKH4_9BACT|nr:exported hypothetical protein [Candidatus Sulfobium mesophilum]
MSLIRFTLFSFIFVLIAGGCASVDVKEKETETIKPSGVHEDCMELLKGQTLDYSFDSSKPLNFNIHYHEDHNVSYVVQKDGISSDHGTYNSGKKQYYCLMWTNSNSEPVKLKYAYGKSKKQD